VILYCLVLRVEEQLIPNVGRTIISAPTLYFRFQIYCFYSKPVRLKIDCGRKSGPNVGLFIDIKLWKDFGAIAILDLTKSDLIHSFAFADPCTHVLNYPTIRGRVLKVSTHLYRRFSGGGVILYRLVLRIGKATYSEFWEDIGHHRRFQYTC